MAGSIKSFKTTVIVSLSILCSWNSPPQQQKSAYDICRATFENTKTIKTLSYNMIKRERIKGEILMQSSFSKLNRNPYQVYLKQLAPKKGLEVLFKAGENDNKALVNTNSFPWVNLNMDPLGSLMRKNQHHTVKDGGFDLVISILEYLFDKYGEDAKPKVTMAPEVMYDGHECYKIIFTNTDFKYIKYTVKADEDILEIAQKYKLSEYMILEINKDISDYDDVSEGDVIIIPNDYSPKMELLIDKVRLIPLSAKVYDDQGLFEYFKYSNVVVNPKFTSYDFDKDNRAYGF